MNPERYRHQNEMAESHQAAEQVVPVILGITGPLTSALDVGGGDGGWLRTFQQFGIGEVMLLDVPEAEPHLLIDRTSFHPIDLGRDLPEPRRFDLALCIECAEHLPAHRAQPLVEWLTRSADIVVFSAAIPGQGGNGHVNEQSQDYWRALFRRHGFERRDVLRTRIIHDTSIAWWYRQNLFMFTAPGIALLEGERDFLPDDFRLIHRDVAVEPRPPAPRTLFSRLARALMRPIRS